LRWPLDGNGLVDFERAALNLWSRLGARRWFSGSFRAPLDPIRSGWLEAARSLGRIFESPRRVRDRRASRLSVALALIRLGRAKFLPATLDALPPHLAPRLRLKALKPGLRWLGLTPLSRPLWSREGTRCWPTFLLAGWLRPTL
jgi:hypothetical protein